jgi:hypothetical protein
LNSWPHACWASTLPFELYPQFSSEELNTCDTVSTAQVNWEMWVYRHPLPVSLLWGTQVYVKIQTIKTFIGHNYLTFRYEPPPLFLWYWGLTSWASHLLGRCFSIWIIPPSLLFCCCFVCVLDIFEIGFHKLFAQVGFKPRIPPCS